VETWDAQSIEFCVELKHLPKLVKNSNLDTVLRHINDLEFANTFNFLLFFTFYILGETQ
jgi:hypothetical protein